MSDSKTCFVVVPHYEERTAAHKLVANLIDKVERAVKQYRFDVAVSEAPPNNVLIAEDTVNKVLEAELCIVLLIDIDPVMLYLVGRRHEAGSPIIHVIREGQASPFESALMHCIAFGNLEDIDTALKIIDDIAEVVKGFEAQGYGDGGSRVTLEEIKDMLEKMAGASLSTVSASLERIEQTVKRIASRPAAPSYSGGAARGGSGIPLGNPKEAFMAAIARGDTQQASALLPRLEQALGPTLELAAASVFLAGAGVEAGAEMFYRLYTEHPDTLPGYNEPEFYKLIGGFLNFYSITDREAEGLARAEPMINEFLSKTDLSRKSEAFYLNQLQKLIYGTGDYERALEIAEKVLILVSDEPAYVFNASLICEKLGMITRAVEFVDRCIQLDDAEASHFAHAVDMYLQVGRVEEARAAYERLKLVSPDRAAILLLDDEVRRQLGA